MLRSFSRAPALLLACVLAAPLFAQSPCFDLNLGTDLNLSDDDTTAPLPLGFTFNYNGVPYTNISICSNGYIWLGNNLQFGGDYTPTMTELLTDQPRLCPLWGDFNPGDPSSGHVYYNNTVPGRATITWAGVIEFGGSNAVEMQVVLDSSSAVTITYGTNPAVGGTLLTDVIIGASPGINATANPVSFAARPFAIAQDNFAEQIPANGSLPIPYAGFQMVWTPTNPGYQVHDNACTPNHFPSPAHFEVVGLGCPNSNSVTFYEQFDTFFNPVDLSGTDFLMVPSGTSYLVAAGAAGPFFTGLTNALPAGDDTTHLVNLPFSFPHAQGAVTQIYVSSNGFLTLGPTDPGPLCCFGDPFMLEFGPPMVAAHWADQDPSSAGTVYADYDTLTGEFVVTWNGVEEYGAPGFNSTFQIALDAGGLIKLRLPTLVSSYHTTLTGYSEGGGAFDVGPRDLSAITFLDIGPARSGTPILLDAQFGSLPQIGTTFTTDVTNLATAPNGNLCIMFIGLEIPGGIDLTPIGLDGCTDYFQLPEIASFATLPLGSGSTSIAVNIPFSQVFVGVQLMAQALSDDLNANPFGWALSNGGRWTLGI